MSRTLIAALAVLIVQGCTTTPPRADVVYTSADGIAFKNPSGSVHFYSFKKGSKD